MKYDRMYAGLRLKPSADGQIELHLDRDVRATVIGTAPSKRLIRIQRDDRGRPETYATRFWIPLRGNRQWRHAIRPADGRD